jgi:hypothetical protein
VIGDFDEPKKAAWRARQERADNRCHSVRMQERDNALAALRIALAKEFPVLEDSFPDGPARGALRRLRGALNRCDSADATLEAPFPHVQ